LRFLFDVVIWVFVPVILAVILYFARSSAKKSVNNKDSSSIKSGFWAGFVLFLIVLVYKVGMFLNNGFPHNEIYQGFDIWLAFGASSATIILFIARKKVVHSGTTGLVVMLISFLSLYALVDYLLIREFNEILLSLTLGITFGALVTFASTPSSIKEFFSIKKKITE